MYNSKLHCEEVAWLAAVFPRLLNWFNNVKISYSVDMRQDPRGEGSFSTTSSGSNIDLRSNIRALKADVSCECGCCVNSSGRGA